MFFREKKTSNTIALLGTLASKPSTGQIGIKILSWANYSATIAPARMPDDDNPWLISSDTVQLEALLKDIATRQQRIREMPYQGHMSFAAGKSMKMISPW